MKIKRKRENDETLGVVHTHTHTHNPLGDDKNMKSTHKKQENNENIIIKTCKEEENSIKIRTQIVVPLIVLLIFIITIILIIWVRFSNSQNEILSKILPQKMMAETANITGNIGENVFANFNSSTGELIISGNGTFNRDMVYEFYNKIGRT